MTPAYQIYKSKVKNGNGHNSSSYDHSHYGVGQKTFQLMNHTFTNENPRNSQSVKQQDPFLNQMDKQSISKNEKQ